jgi:hypothetical protein
MTDEAETANLEVEGSTATDDSRITTKARAGKSPAKRRAPKNHKGEVTESENEIVDVAENAINGSGYVLPLIHTSIDAALVTEGGGHRVLLTVDHAVLETPPLEHLAFYAGLATLVGAGLVEWPIGVAIGVGHLLIDLTRRPGLEALGEALEEA